MSENKFCLVVVGGGGVGKSSITLRFMRGEFGEEYDPTIEDSYCKQINYDGTDYTLDIIDTAGQEEYRGLWGDKFMRNGDGFLCVYSITSKSSFEELEVFREQIFRAKDDEKCPLIILGNKCDLAEYREVSEAEGQEFAKSSNALFLETSAKENINVEEAFRDLVKHIQATGGPSHSEKAAAAASESKPAPAAETKKQEKEGGCCMLL
eukprot:Lithocolla_globosa_v1_NODE_6206_length_1122_cov_21.157451.p1 type:complete len:208 gc:universal NODE_6206_length_1122_cov_21.157451:1021-398(-)